MENMYEKMNIEGSHSFHTKEHIFDDHNPLKNIEEIWPKMCFLITRDVFRKIKNASLTELINEVNVRKRLEA